MSVHQRLLHQRVATVRLSLLSQLLLASAAVVAGTL
jgi:hypothetical protein